jgi:hypothetical protein
LAACLMGWLPPLVGVTEVLEREVLEREDSKDLVGEVAGVLPVEVPRGVTALSRKTAIMAWMSISAVLRVS